MNRAPGGWQRTALAALILVACIAAGRSPLADEGLSAEAGRLSKLLGLDAGSTVAEIGAGAGEMTVEIARVVGETGHLYSTELGDEKVAGIRAAVRRAGARGVTVIEGADSETRLPASCCDAIYMRRVYHHFTHPAEIDASLFASLRPGGRLAVIDFEPRGGTPPAGVPANRKGHGVPATVVVEELARAGFEHVRTEDWTEGMYLALFRRPQ